jgi:hypothetical protein
MALGPENVQDLETVMVRSTAPDDTKLTGSPNRA